MNMGTGHSRRTSLDHLIASLAIQEMFGIKLFLVHSAKTGAFEVTADGEAIFSKSATGVFPSKEESVVKMHELNIVNQTK
jgi:selT/selW/selH-like putative selenoprotein